MSVRLNFPARVGDWVTTVRLSRPAALVRVQGGDGTVALPFSAGAWVRRGMGSFLAFVDVASQGAREELLSRRVDVWGGEDPPRESLPQGGVFVIRMVQKQVSKSFVVNSIAYSARTTFPLSLLSILGERCRRLGKVVVASLRRLIIALCCHLSMHTMMQPTFYSLECSCAHPNNCDPHTIFHRNTEFFALKQSQGQHTLCFSHLSFTLRSREHRTEYPKPARKDTVLRISASIMHNTFPGQVDRAVYESTEA